MKKIFAFAMVLMPIVAFAGDCGPGYVLANHAKIDGMAAQECQKLWCVDLETGKPMGAGARANNGYVTTASPIELCDVTGRCVECFGDRKWCAGIVRGVWNPEYGAYTRGGADTATYGSEQKGGCWTWKLEKPKCDAGQDAILKDGEWVCAVAKTTGNIGRAPAIRRTSAPRRMLRR